MAIPLRSIASRLCGTLGEPLIPAIYPHPAAFPGVCDTQTLYFSMPQSNEIDFKPVNRGLKGLQFGYGYRQGLHLRAYFIFCPNPGFSKRKRLACLTLDEVTPPLNIREIVTFKVRRRLPCLT